jgi:hypothetical protein
MQSFFHPISNIIFYGGLTHMEMEIGTFEAEEAEENKSKSRLNSRVALTVVLLVTFMGLSRVKSENIVMGMQKAQADKIDNWAWYQARNIREDVYRATAAQFEAQSKVAPPTAQQTWKTQAEIYSVLAEKQNKKKEGVQAIAENAEKRYEVLEVRHEQLDLSEALLSIAVAMLGITALTQKRWLYWAALVPELFGFIMGISGFCKLPLHMEWLARLFRA